MNISLDQIRTDVKRLMDEWLKTDYLKEDGILVVGCSTSEVAGKKIGTSGSEEVAAAIFKHLHECSKERKFHLAFQCCEHLNRAIVVERSIQKKLSLSPVTVIPVREAGGSMASYAFQQFQDAVVVEEIEADAGLDIGGTMIGMHLKKVAVPVRFEQTKIGNAHIIVARTRPKLIGGPRATYPEKY